MSKMSEGFYTVTRKSPVPRENSAWSPAGRKCQEDLEPCSQKGCSHTLDPQKGSADSNWNLIVLSIGTVTKHLGALERVVEALPAFAQAYEI